MLVAAVEELVVVAAAVAEVVAEGAAVVAAVVAAQVVVEVAAAGSCVRMRRCRRGRGKRADRNKYIMINSSFALVFSDQTHSVMASPQL